MGRKISEEASTALQKKASGETDDPAHLDVIARRFERQVRATGVNGAYLLLLARGMPGLRELLFFDVPLLPAGLADSRLLKKLKTCDVPSATDGYEHLRSKAGPSKPKTCKLKILSAGKATGPPLRDVVKKAIEERDPDVNSKVRDWYTGIPIEDRN